MKVLSLSSGKGEPRYCQSQQVDHWFWERGYEVIPFDRRELLDGELDRYLVDDRENTIVYGAVAIVHDALRRLSIPSPPNMDFPESLRAFFGRRIWHTTMDVIRETERSRPHELPLHVKPRDRQKLFKGTLVRDYASLIPLAGVEDSEPVIAQESVVFRSEWRATVLRGAVINVAHYKGDPLAFPDASRIAAAVAAFAEQPIGFALDWGVTDRNETILVEANDGFALGNYGVRGHQYTAMIECRWRELVGLADNGVGWAVS
jgi:hypothetical protein